MPLNAFGIHCGHIIPKAVDSRIGPKISRPKALAGAAEAAPLLGCERSEGRDKTALSPRSNLYGHDDWTLQSDDIELKWAQSDVATPDLKAPTFKKPNHFCFSPLAGPNHSFRSTARAYRCACSSSSSKRSEAMPTRKALKTQM